MSQDQILGKGFYSDLQDQALYDEHTLFLCNTAHSNSCDRIEELGKRVESYIWVKHGQRETFSDFLQRLTKEVS